MNHRPTTEFLRTLRDYIANYDLKQLLNERTMELVLFPDARPGNHIIFFFELPRLSYLSIEKEDQLLLCRYRRDGMPRQYESRIYGKRLMTEFHHLIQTMKNDHLTVRAQTLTFLLGLATNNMPLIECVGIAGTSIQSATKRSVQLRLGRDFNVSIAAPKKKAFVKWQLWDEDEQKPRGIVCNNPIINPAIRTHLRILQRTLRQLSQTRP